MNPKPLELVVDESNQGKRIDKFLSEQIDSLTRSQAALLVDQKKARVNQEPVSKSYKVKSGDKIDIVSLARDSLKLKPENLDLKIVYEDPYLLIVSKPAGMVCHPGPGHRQHTLVNALLYHSRKLSDGGEEMRPGIVHRLDKDTSGLVVVAKDNHTHHLLSEMFKQRQVEKIYCALVWGRFTEKKGTIILPLARSERDRKEIAVSTEGGRQACTEFEVKRQFKDCSWLSINLKTGRTHQIRVHMKHIGHPVLGDATYRIKESEKLAQYLGLSRQFLHAVSLEFIHPVKKTRVKATDTLPSQLQSVLNSLIINE